MSTNSTRVLFVTLAIFVTSINIMFANNKIADSQEKIKQLTLDIEQVKEQCLETAHRVDQLQPQGVTK